MDNMELEIYKINADKLIEHYGALVSHVRKYLFPWKFKTLDWLPNTSNWSVRKKMLFAFFTPLAILDSDYNKSIDSSSISLILGAIVVWIYYFLSVFAFGLISVFLLSGIVPNSTLPENQSPSTSVYLLTGGWLLSLVIIGLILYIQTFWYWFNQKTTWGSRILYFASIFITVYFFLLYIHQPSLIIQGISAIATNLPTMAFKEKVLIFSIIFFWIPFILLSVLVILNFAKFLLQSVSVIPLYFLKAHSTDYSQFIKKIISEPIDISGEKFVLASLPTSEIIALKEWAQNSLDATEKKTVPAILLTALLTILITFSAIQDQLTVVLTFLAGLILAALSQDVTNLQGFFINVFVIGITELFVIFAIFMFSVYIRLFGNLFVQGIIVETCTVAEYAKLESEKERAKQAQPNSPWQSILNLFFGKK